MKPFITTSAATGREYWRLKRVEREKFFILFVIAEMIIHLNSLRYEYELAEPAFRKLIG